MRKLVLISIALVFSFIINGQNKLVAELLKDSVLVGQPATLKLTLELDTIPIVDDVIWAEFQDSIAPGVEVVKEKDVFIKKIGASSKLTQEVMVAADEIGHYPIPPIQVFFNGEEFSSQALLLNVYSTLKNPAAEEMRDYEESLDISYGIIDFIFDNWYWTFPVLLVLAGFIYFMYTKKRREKLAVPEPEPIVEVIPPLNTALAKLSDLEQKKLWQTGQLKEYHSKISYILREYLEEEISVNALENPTSEIMKALRKFGFDPSLNQKIKVSLSLTDLVKFAKQKPTETENRQVLEDARNAVKEIHKHLQS